MLVTEQYETNTAIVIVGILFYRDYLTDVWESRPEVSVESQGKISTSDE